MEKVKIALVGDIMCGDQFNHIGWGTASALKKHGKSFLEKDIINILKGHDLTIGNVECVLSRVGLDQKSVRSLHMRGYPESAELLSDWGVNVCNIANNHILEHGIDAANDTNENLKEAGVNVVGFEQDNGKPKWCEINLNTLSISILGLCLRDEKYALYYSGNITEIVNEIEERKKKNHIIIVSLHWGDELIEYPSLLQRNLAQKLLDVGVSVLYGHHPHVVQGYAVQNESVVAYSLGNFIFDSWCNKTSWSMILSISIVEGRVVSIEAIPLVRGKDFRPKLVSGNRLKAIHNEILRRNNLVKSEIANSKIYENEYGRRLKKLNRYDRVKLWLRVFLVFFKTSPKYWGGIFLRPVLRRLNKW